MIISAQEGKADTHCFIKMYTDVEQCPCGKSCPMRNVLVFEVTPTIPLADGGAFLLRPPVYYTEMGNN